MVLDLLSTLPPDEPDSSMPVAALISAGSILGLAQNNVRVTLSRMRTAGLVERDERGLYRLSGAASAVSEQISTWRRSDVRPGAWRGSWVAVHRRRGGSGGRSRVARESDRALRLLGFRRLESGLDVRPDNRRGGVGGMRDRLAGLGLEPGALVSGLSDLDPVSERRARGLWDADVLCRGYDVALGWLSDSTARLPELSVEAAMRETFVVGGHVLRAIILDPQLPEAIVPTAGRCALVDRMCAYDRLGRSYWAEFLGRYGVVHKRNSSGLSAGWIDAPLNPPRTPLHPTPPPSTPSPAPPDSPGPNNESSDL
jgi:phenylacetic acid degradation operon negative regulatory protein